jgi:DNA-binding transcriptional LysR family regulator
MQARQISYFLAVVEHGGFSRAAAVLEIAQPTLSQSVKSLERQLGAELFHRTARGLVLSAAGRAFVGPARQLVRDMALVQDMASARASVGGNPVATLDLVAAPPLAVFPAAALVGSFRVGHPHVTVRLDKPDDDEALPGMVRDGTSELGLSYLPVVRLGLSVCELGVHELRIAFPPGTEVSPGPVPLARLEGLGLVGIPTGSWQRDLVETALRSAGVRTRLVAELAQRDTIMELVLGGVGAAFLVADAADTAVQQGVQVRAVDPPLRRAFGLVHRAHPLSPPARAFLAHAQAAHAQAAHSHAQDRDGRP